MWHLWSTCKPSGIGPLWAVYDHLCAIHRFSPGAGWKCPYPSGVPVPCHIQQPLSLGLICRWKRASCALFMGGRLTY